MEALKKYLANKAATAGGEFGNATMRYRTLRSLFDAGLHGAAELLPKAEKELELKSATGDIAPRLSRMLDNHEDYIGAYKDWTKFGQPNQEEVGFLKGLRGKADPDLFNELSSLESVDRFPAYYNDNRSSPSRHNPLTDFPDDVIEKKIRGFTKWMQKRNME